MLVYVHEDRLGDALLKLPAMAALRRAFPGADITWLAGGGPSLFAGQLAPLAEGLVDRVEDRLRLGCSWREWRQRPPLAGRYGVIIDTQTVLRATLLLRRLPHDRFISPAARFLFSDRRPGAEGFGGNLRRRLLQLIRLAAAGPVGDDYELRLPRAYRDLAAGLLPPGPVYVGLAPGAGGRDKCWPLERYLELGRLQLDRGRTPVFLLGPDEREWLPVIRERLPGALLPEEEPVAGSLRGPLLCMALAGRLAAAVANDSGAGHLLAFGGAPLVSLFGRTSVEKFVEDGGVRLVVRAEDFGSDRVGDIPLAAADSALEECLRGGAS